MNGRGVVYPSSVRLPLIDSSLQALLNNKQIFVQYGLTAPPSSAAVIEFDVMDRLTFATREAQELLRFTIEPLWGKSFSFVLQRVPQPPSLLEWLTPAVQPPSQTTRTIGHVRGWLRLVMSDGRVLTICLRDNR